MMKLAAASCAKIQDIDPRLAWAEIQQERPDVLLLLGDNVCLPSSTVDQLKTVDPSALLD